MIGRIDWINVVVVVLIGCGVLLLIVLGVLLFNLMTSISNIDTDSQNEQAISVRHVDDEAVTCFIWDGDSFNGGLDCIPDWQLAPPQINLGD